MKKIRAILPHAAIILAGMYVVFFFIDKVNSAMDFINNDITKFLLLILSVLTVFNSIQLIRFYRTLERNRLRKLKKQKQNASGTRTKKPSV